MYLLLPLALLTAVLVLSAATEEIGENYVDSNAAQPRIRGALFLLKEKERERFVAECVQSLTVCSKQEIEDFVFKTERIQNMAQEWFWSSYLCYRKDDPTLCPVDGGWTHWGPWLNCTATCGKGVVSRHRSCTHPLPANGGRECSGAMIQLSDCDTHIPCHFDRGGVMSNDTINLLTDMMTVLEPFHTEDPELKRACFKGHCSYQQVVGMIQPLQLASRYWSRLNCYKYLEGCPGDGGWSSWKEWSTCTSECGTGQTFRSRICDNPHPTNGGKDCPGDPVEEKDCFRDTCSKAVGTFLTDWTPWSSCSEGCDLGTRVSTRRCHGSDTCMIGTGDEVRQVRSLSRRAPCMTGLCPVIGAWEQWSEWSLCSSICSPGYHIRVRSCSNPLPVGLGNECPGDGYEKESCEHNAESCTGVPRDREYGLWGTWSTCSSSCNGGVKLRHRVCIDHQKLECTGPIYNTWPCNIKQPCPVDGGWTEWSSWTPCSLTCGMGGTSRYRICSSPWPRHGGNECEGKASQVKKCRDVKCPALTPYWGSWGEWNDCSASCEGGIKQRQRWCLVRKPGIRRLVRVKMTKNCAGEFHQFAVCNIHTCPVDGSWTSWGAWSPCTAPCDEGVMSRDRSCSDPAPVGNGTVCEGYGSDTRHCFQLPCAKKGSIKVAFEGSSFLIYSRSAHPAHHLLLFLVLRPVDPHGLLVLRRDEETTDVVLMVRLVDSHVHLYVEIGSHIQIDFTGEQVTLNTWNSLEVGITGHEAWLRVNDGDITYYEIQSPIPADLNWDLPMYIGGALPNLFPAQFDKIGGFTGELSKLRVNYKEYSLRETDEWEGGGLPYVSFNIEERTSQNIDGEVPMLTGEEYTTLPFINQFNSSKTPNMISLTVRSADGEGIIVYTTGESPGSFFMLSLRESKLVLTFCLGRSQNVIQRVGGAIEKNEWSLIDITIKGFTAEVHVNKGPAAQLTAIGHTHFRPSPTLYVGGVSRRERLQVAKNSATSRGFVGEILEAKINWMDFQVYEAAFTTDVLVNSASATVAAHFRDIHAKIGASVLLRCQYGHVVNEIEDAHRWIRTEWLYNGDRLLEFNPQRKIIPSEASHPYSASLLLMTIPQSAEGFYACQVTFRGVSIITHAFSVSVEEEAGDGFAVDRTIDIIIVVGASSFVFVVGVIILMSCCAPCRRWSYLLDILYESMMHCCGCQAVGAFPPGVTYMGLAQVDATYDPYFDPRAEKSRLDAEIARREYQQSSRGMRDEDEDEEQDGEVEGDDGTGNGERQMKDGVGGENKDSEDNEESGEDEQSDEDEKSDEDEESENMVEEEEEYQKDEEMRIGGENQNDNDQSSHATKKEDLDTPQYDVPENRESQPRQHSKTSIDHHRQSTEMVKRGSSHIAPSVQPDITMATQQLSSSDSKSSAILPPPPVNATEDEELWFAQTGSIRNVTGPSSLQPSFHEILNDVHLPSPPTLAPSSSHTTSQPPPTTLAPPPLSTIVHPSPPDLSPPPPPTTSPPPPPTITPPPPPNIHSPDVSQELTPNHPSDAPANQGIADILPLENSSSMDSIHQIRRYTLADLTQGNSSTIMNASLVAFADQSMQPTTPDVNSQQEDLQSSLSSTWLPEDYSQIPRSSHKQVHIPLALPPTSPPQSSQLSRSPRHSPPQSPPEASLLPPPGLGYPSKDVLPPPPPPPPGMTSSPSIVISLSALPPMVEPMDSREQLQSPLGTSVADVSRDKVEINRRRRMNTGARLGARSHILQKADLSSTELADAKVEESVDLTVNCVESSSINFSSKIAELTMSSGDFVPMESEHGSQGLVSELMDSLHPEDRGKLEMKGDGKVETVWFDIIGQDSHFIVETVDNFVCEDCRNKGISPFKSCKSVESNEYVTCGDASS